MEFLKSRIKSFKYAFQGLFDLFSSQPNARIHLIIGIIVLILGYFLSLTYTEWILVTLAIASVLAAESFNTAIEYLTDLVSPNHHPLAGKVKDLSAAAVLITATGAALIGLIIFLPKLFS